MAPTRKSNSKGLARSLKPLLVGRDVKTGLESLERYFADNRRLDPSDPGSYELLFLLAQWVDLGFRDVDFLEGQFAAFEKGAAHKLEVSQYVRLKLAEAYVRLARRRDEEAVALLRAAAQLFGELLSPHEQFICHFWLARVYRQSGSFEQAYAEIREARRHAATMQGDRLDAVAKIHESWLVFYRGDRRMAFQLLDEAEAALAGTDHPLSLANIAAARGRFIRSTGDYERALGFFEQAIRIHRENSPMHPNLARALVNAAYVKRLMAMELRSRNSDRATAAVHARSLKLVAEAIELLRAAGQIYAHYQHQGGTGSVLINLGHLKLESGEIDSASEESDAAFSLSQQKNDPALMARARILQAYIQAARAEEQLDDSSSPLSSPQKALQFAEDAISLAESTQNQRLLAGAYITHGLALTIQPETDWELARSRAESAAALLGNQDRDHLFGELSRLRSRIAQPGTAEGTLRRWMAGEVGAKSFQQIEEEFAQIVIPRVWVKMGRNISRVAQELNVSPKKVRRALRNARAIEDSVPAGKTTGRSSRQRSPKAPA